MNSNYNIISSEQPYLVLVVSTIFFTNFNNTNAPWCCGGALALLSLVKNSVETTKAKYENSYFCGYIDSTSHMFP